MYCYCLVNKIQFKIKNGQEPLSQGVCRPRKNPVSPTVQIFSQLKNRFTCIPMGDVLTSGDLHVGHSDLGPYILVDPTKENNNTINTA